MFSVPTENLILKDKFTIKMKIQSSSPHPSVLVESQDKTFLEHHSETASQHSAKQLK